MDRGVKRTLVDKQFLKSLSIIFMKNIKKL